jgi:hypothetical protein
MAARTRSASFGAWQPERSALNDWRARCKGLGGVPNELLAGSSHGLSRRRGQHDHLESAYSKKKGTPAPVAGVMATAALDGLTLDEISSRITRWYAANPSRRNMPVIGVLWVDMVQPAGTAK